MLSEYLRLPRECVFAVIHENRNMAYINYTENIASALARLYEDLARPTAGETLILRVLEASSDPVQLRLCTEYWRDRYRNMGYSELFPLGRKSIQYRVTVQPRTDFKGVEVALVTSRGDRIVVGIFKTIKDARGFVVEYYGPVSNQYKFPVYATNSLTKEFLSKKKTEILDIR